MKKIIALDLDGTTLNKQSLITERTKEVLHLAQEAGHSIILATGRPYPMSRMFYSQLGLKDPMLNLNGAIVHLPEKPWNLEKHFTLSRDIVFDLIAEKETLGFNFIAAENKETFYIDDLNYYQAAFFSDQASKENLLTPKTLYQDPASIMIGATEESVHSLINTLKMRYGNLVEVRTWGGNSPMIEVTQKGVHKAHSLEYLGAKLSFKPKDVIAFGDEKNDVEMISWAGHGVAMENGTLAVKEAANDMTTFSNDANGVAEYLVDYLQLEKNNFTSYAI